MKKIISILSLSLLALTAAQLAQAQSDRQPPPRRENEPVRKIEVYGNAERELTPDEIYFTITLKEYMGDNNKKVDINKLERELYEAVRKMGIRDEDFRVQDVAGYNYDWNWRNRKKDREEFLASKQYQITFKDLNEINRIFSYVDAKGIQSTNIAGYSHSKLETIQRELKIEALKDAKAKAAYLLEGIQERIGEVLEVQEINNDYQPPIYYRAETMAMAKADSGMAQPEIEFQKIKLQAQVRTVFRIQ